MLRAAAVFLPLLWRFACSLRILPTTNTFISFPLHHAFSPQVPYFNAGVFLANKTQVGRVEEIFGPTTDVMFTVKCGDGVVATSFAPKDKLYVDPYKLLPMARFLNPVCVGCVGCVVVGGGCVGERGARVQPFLTRPSFFAAGLRRGAAVHHGGGHGGAVSRAVRRVGFAAEEVVRLRAAGASRAAHRGGSLAAGRRGGASAGAAGRERVRGSTPSGTPVVCPHFC